MRKIIIMGLVVVSIMGGFKAVGRFENTCRWNNGVCSVCGNELHYNDSIRIKESGIVYRYDCGFCGYRVVLNSMR